MNVRGRNLRAILTMLMGVVVFSGMDAGLKGLSARYPPLQVAFLRSAASMPFLLLWLGMGGHWHRLTVVRPWLYVARGVLGVVMLAAFVSAVSMQGLEQTYAIFMSAPLMIVAMSQLMLKETVRPARWIAVLVGFVGVLIALHPSTHGLIAFGGLMALLSAVCYSLGAMSVRILGRTDSNQAMVFWYMLLVVIGSGALVLWRWHAVARGDWPLIALVGVLGMLGQALFTSAFRMAPAAVIAPFEYTALIWGGLLDRIVFAIVPTAPVITGGLIVIAGGLYLAWDERRQ